MEIPIIPPLPTGPTSSDILQPDIALQHVCRSKSKTAKTLIAAPADLGPTEHYRATWPYKQRFGGGGTPTSERET